MNIATYVQNQNPPWMHSTIDGSRCKVNIVGLMNRPLLNFGDILNGEQLARPVSEDL